MLFRHRILKLTTPRARRVEGGRAPSSSRRRLDPGCRFMGAPDQVLFQGLDDAALVGVVAISTEQRQRQAGAEDQDQNDGGDSPEVLHDCLTWPTRRPAPSWFIPPGGAALFCAIPGQMGSASPTSQKTRARGPMSTRTRERLRTAQQLASSVLVQSIVRLQRSANRPSGPHPRYRSLQTLDTIRSCCIRLPVRLDSECADLSPACQYARLACSIQYHRPQSVPKRHDM